MSTNYISHWSECWRESVNQYRQVLVFMDLMLCLNNKSSDV